MSSSYDKFIENQNDKKLRIQKSFKYIKDYDWLNVESIERYSLNHPIPLDWTQYMFVSPPLIWCKDEQNIELMIAVENIYGSFCKWWTINSKNEQENILY